MDFWMRLLVCCAKDFGVCPVHGSWANGSSSQLTGVFLLLEGLEGGWLFQPDVEGLDVEGGAKGEKDNVFLGLGGSIGRLPAMAGGLHGSSF